MESWLLSKILIENPHPDGFILLMDYAHLVFSKRTRWIDQMYVAHILDHEYRSVVRHEKRDQLELENPLI